MGLPGFSGFIAELQVLTGAWAVFPRLTILAGVGILVGIAFMVRVWIKAFFAENDAPATTIRIEPISIPERAGAFLLLGTTVLIGLWPGLLLNLITPTLHSPLFQPLCKGGLP
jgi:NADH-quinone oxidoreductase subunit M